MRKLWSSIRNLLFPDSSAAARSHSSTLVAYTDGTTTRSQSVDLPLLLETTLSMAGIATTRSADGVRLDEAGYLLTPQVEGVAFKGPKGFQTATTILASHPMLPPEGVFEFQHAGGSTLHESISSGFEQWMQVDLPALLDATRPSPETCKTLRLHLPAKEGRTERHRRAVLGPTAHLMSNPPPEPPTRGDRCDDDHDFCPSCLLTRSYLAFKELFEGEGFYALRLFASVGPDGEPQADCRVNGEDFPAGAAALRDYASTWPPTGGLEFRKQYVILQDDPGAPTEGTDTA